MKALAMSYDVQAEAIEIGHTMMAAKLPKSFVVAAVKTAFEFEGVFNLMKMWSTEQEQDERDEIIAEIQDLIDDCNQHEKVDASYVRFDDLDAIAKDIRAFKDNLRAIVDKRGGIGHLAALTEIPQPSLSRFFNSASMPRRTTLQKIAKALKLSQIEIATEWSR